MFLLSFLYNNLNLYFSPASYPAAWLESPSAGKAIATLVADHDVYYFGEPFFTTKTNAILFYSSDRSLQATDVTDPETVIPLPKPAERDVAFVFAYGNFAKLDDIQQHYPGGTFQEWADYKGLVILRVYIVPQEVANNPA